MFPALKQYLDGHKFKTDDDTEMPQSGWLKEYDIEGLYRLGCNAVFSGK
jgi:hypothetical protein